ASDHLRPGETARIEVERAGLPDEQSLEDFREQDPDQEVDDDGSIDGIAADAAGRQEAAEEEQPAITGEEQPARQAQDGGSQRDAGTERLQVEAGPYEGERGSGTEQQREQPVLPAISEEIGRHHKGEGRDQNP